MNDDTITRLNQQQLTETIAHHKAWLDQNAHDWQLSLAHCCIHCADIEWGQPMDHLDALYTAWWLLNDEPTRGVVSFYLEMTKDQKQPRKPHKP